MVEQTIFTAICAVRNQAFFVTPMQIFVRGLANSLAFTVDADTTIDEIHQAIADKVSCHKNDFFLTFHGTPMTENETIDDFEISPHDFLDINMKLYGGKTHGGLAKAGWVKNNTPKVEPQEKKKKKTGRAHRREQYARRFLNKVDTRRSPNANY